MCQPRKWWVGLAPLLALWFALNWTETQRIEHAVADAADKALAGATGDTGFSQALGRDVSLNGWVFDDTTRAPALAAAASAAGVRLVADGLSAPPAQNPYLFHATLDAGVLTLSGAVSSPAERAALIAAAKGALPEARVVDELGYYSGAPKDFVSGAATGFRTLSHLSSGEAQLRGADLSLRGLAPDAAEYQAAMAETQRTPEGIKLAGAEIAPPKARVFSFQAENDAGRLTLSGFVASEAQRGTLLSRAKKLFPNTTLDDRLQIASGAPDKFVADAAFALSALAQLKSGKASLVDGKTSLTGQARQGMNADAVAAAAGHGAPLDLAGVKAGEPAPFVMGAEKSETALTLSGVYADEDARAKILQAAKDHFPGLAVVDKMSRAIDAPKSATTAALLGLEQLARLRVGAFGLSDGKASLSGDARAAETADQIKTRFIADMPDGFAVDTQLTGAARETPQPAEAPPSVAPATAAAGPDAAAATPAPVAEAEAPVPAATPPAAPPSEADAKSCQARLMNLVHATPIQFEFGSAALAAESSKILDALAAAANGCPSVSFTVSGHTDDIGLVSHNRELSRRRAQAVVDYLSHAGIGAGRLTAVGYGESRPLAPNDSDEGRAKNRRIEFDLK
jgi:outer membrane protein OmpA-like peptidoglycan-associated protein/osmotically-inducible protein OsmY